MSLSALFLVRFDPRKGNVIAWIRKEDDNLNISDGLEFKALPSGLHTVERDLIYFLHDGFAGATAFLNLPASSAERNACFLSVGVLRARNGSRLGRAWQSLEDLQRLAEDLKNDLLHHGVVDDGQANRSTAVSSEAVAMLDQFFERHNNSASPSEDNNASATSSSAKIPRKRAFSDTVNLDRTKHHPSASLIPLLDSCGPLIFPLQRAALLQKRTLLVQKPPLHLACDLVYLISVLGSLPSSVAEELPDLPTRIESLFAIGTYDIASLEKRNRQAVNDADSASGPLLDGWIACTSDELLSTKSDLYDVKLDFTKSRSGNAPDPCWPSLTTNKGTVLRATQRDLKRYKALRQKVYNITHSLDDRGSSDNAEVTGLLAQESTHLQWSVPEENSVAESLPWPAVAYDSFIWWASAGESSGEMQDESELDAHMLDACFSGRPRSPLQSRRSMSARKDDNDQSPELSIVTYFHRLTASIFMTLSDCLPEVDQGTSQASDEKEAVNLSRNDLLAMGLDKYSPVDRDFVEELSAAYFDKAVHFSESAVYCCGVRIV